MNRVPGLSQNPNTRRNRRRITLGERKTHSFQLGASPEGKALKQDALVSRSIGRVDRTYDLSHLVSGPRHHARCAVGLQFETVWVQKFRDANPAQRLRQCDHPMRWTRQDVFYGVSSAHGMPLSVDCVKGIHDGVSLTAGYFADRMMRAVGYLEEQGLSRYRWQNYAHVFGLPATEE